MGDPSSIRHIFREETWSQCSFKYSLAPREFVKIVGANTDFRRILSFMQLFSLFWPYTLLQKIVIETNRYATTVDDHSKCPGGAAWIRLTVAELKAFLAESMFMGLKRHPNLKTCWSRKGSFFHCPRISQIFTHACFQSLTRCLHITNPATYVTNREVADYDKMGQVRWLVAEVRANFRQHWKLEKF